MLIKEKIIMKVIYVHDPAKGLLAKQTSEIMARYMRSVQKTPWWFKLLAVLKYL